MFRLSSDRQHSTPMLTTSHIQLFFAEAAPAAMAPPYWNRLVDDKRRCGTARTLAERLMR